jgi:transposase
MRKRAELLVHIQNTNSQYNLPEFGKRISQKKNREGVAERFSDSSVQKSIELDLQLIDSYDQLLADVELHILRAAREHDGKALIRLRSVPGIGQILALVILYEIHDVNRFASVQDFVSYARLVKCAKESAGKRYGTSGSKIGNVHLKWAFSEASVLFLRANPKGQKYVDKLSSKHGKAKALSILAHKLGRAVYYMLKRKKNFDMNKFFGS